MMEYRDGGKYVGLAAQGLLPEGIQLEAMLRRCKLDRPDLFGQLILAGQDLVGSRTVKEVA